MISSLALLPFPPIDPVAFRIGPVAVRWYGIAYLLGFLASYLGLRAMIRRGLLRITEAQLGDLITWAVVGVMVGGRGGWWLFYHRPTAGAAEPWYEPLAIWHGGMSFHGALIGVALALAVWSRIRRVSLANVADCAALVAPIGLFFGRLANFLNAELVGRVTTVPWAVIFPGHNTPRHPSQLYEAILEGPVLFASLWTAKLVMRPGDGRIAALFLSLYGLFRFAVEFTREPDPQLGFIAFGWLTMGQALSALMVLIGVVALLTMRRRRAGTIPPTDGPEPTNVRARVLAILGGFSGGALSPPPRRARPRPEAS